MTTAAPPLAPASPPATFPTAPNCTLDRMAEPVDESHYTDAFTDAEIQAGRERFAAIALLVPEPENPYDPQAIAVHLPTGKVAHLSRDDARGLRATVDAAIRQHGVCAVAAGVTVKGDRYSIVLEPDRAERLSQQAHTSALAAAGFHSREGDGAGFSMRPHDDRWLVFFSGANTAAREANVPKMAKALREAGYKARVVREDDYPKVSVRQQQRLLLPLDADNPARAHPQHDVPRLFKEVDELPNGCEACCLDGPGVDLPAIDLESRHALILPHTPPKQVATSLIATPSLPTR